MKLRSLLTIIVLCGLIAFFSGVYGFRDTSPDLPLSTCVYLTIQLFTLESGASVSNPTFALELARWLAPATTLGSVIASVVVSLQKLRTWFGLRFETTDSIVMGLSPETRQLALEIMDRCKRRRRVYAVSLDNDVAENDILKRSGVVFINSDPSQIDVLGKICLRSVERIICGSSCDLSNIEVALAVDDACRKISRDKPLQIAVQVRDLAVRDVFQRNNILELSALSSSSFHIYNPARNLARLLFERYPLEQMSNDSGVTVGSDIQLILPRLDDLAIACLVQAARIGYFREGGRLKVLLLSSVACSDIALIQSYYPGIANCIDLEPITIDDHDFLSACALRISQLGEGSRSTVFLGSKDEHQAFSQALLFNERLRNSKGRWRLILSAGPDSVLRRIISNDSSASKLQHRIGFFPVASESVGVDAVFNHTLDRVARIIHQTWYDEETERITADRAQGRERPVKSTYRRWEDLDENQKDVNRFAADHVSVKIRAAGFDPNDADIQKKWSELDEETLTALSRAEHNRWAAQLYLAGWQFAPVRDEANRQHPNLCDFDDLDRATKDYDLQMVRRTAYFWVASKKGL